MKTRKFVFIPIIIALIASVSSGQTTIALCGKVTNAAGSPVSGVTVKLQKANLTTLSGTDGSYCINSNAVVSPAAEGIALRRDCFISGKRLVVSLVNGDRFAARLFDIRGRTLWERVEPSLGAGSHEILLPVGRISAQTGLLLVNAGATPYAFRFAGCGRESFVFSRVKAPAGGRNLAKPAAAAAAILDTLVATGSGFATNNIIRSYVYLYVDTVDFALGEPDSFSEARQQIVHRVNDYRATLSLKRLIRNRSMDACVDTQAQMDYASGTAHSAFGHCKEFAQNECPGWTGTNVLKIADNIVISCMQAMWDEGPGTPYSAHGHYINMTNTAYSKIACGFYCKVSGTSTVRDTMCAAQDFF